MKIAKIFALQPNVLQCDDSLKLSLSYYAKKKPLQNCKLFCAMMSNVQRLFEALYRDCSHTDFSLYSNLLI